MFWFLGGYMEYLFHYTSLENLALILSNKTICFNNLSNVDDSEESETEDMGRFGRFVYVSCWTDAPEESIALWKLYTPDMHGVRIKLPKFPFKKYFYKKGEMFLSEDTETFINLKNLYNDNKASIVSNQPLLVRVTYTADSSLLIPKIRHESREGALQDFLQLKDLSDLSADYEASYDFKHLGKYKREYWSFQKEWRYIISSAPQGLKDSAPPTLEKQQSFIRAIEDLDSAPPYNQLFLELDDAALEKMEITFGPKMSAAEKILAKSLLAEFYPTCNYKDSYIKIK